MGYTLKLISEHIDHNTDYLIEQDEKSGKKNYKIKGIFMQGDITNRNGRRYPMQTLIKEVKRYQKEYIDKKRAFGELGHPQGPTINLDRVSHMITNLTPEGSNIIGEAKILDTPMGNIVKNLMNEGATIGVSSRGIGSLKPTREGVNIVGDDFMLATAADIVADPSAPDAFVEGIMEGKEWVWEGTLLREKKAEEIRNSVEKLTIQRRLDEQKLNLFNDFLNSI